MSGWMRACLAVAALALVLATAGGAARAAISTQGCATAEDMPAATLTMAANARATVTPLNCPIAMAAGDTYIVYDIAWQSRPAERFIYADPARPSSQAVVDVAIKRAGPALIVIDEQQERGGHAVLVWRAGANRFFARKFPYAGTDEGSLKVSQKGSEVSAVFIGPGGRVVGPVQRFHLAAGGIVR